jgi:hypothetical protein
MRVGSVVAVGHATTMLVQDVAVDMLVSGHLPRYRGDQGCPRASQSNLCYFVDAGLVRRTRIRGKRLGNFSGRSVVEFWTVVKSRAPFH